MYSIMSIYISFSHVNEENCYYIRLFIVGYKFNHRYLESVFTVGGSTTMLN